MACAPGLRLLRFRYAVAEARVRSAAAATWPTLGVGPKGVLVPDDFLGGGVLDLSVPLPAATRPAICAAIIERTAAREALEDELLRTLARNRSLNAQMIELRDRVQPRTWDRREAADRMWRAAHAQFLSNETALNGWILALEMRLEAAMSAVESGESEHLLTADIVEAVEPPRAPMGDSRWVDDVRRALDEAETRPQ
jgi:hypothetical protein